MSSTTVKCIGGVVTEPLKAGPVVGLLLPKGKMGDDVADGLGFMVDGIDGEAKGRKGKKEKKPITEQAMLQEHTIAWS